MMARVCSNTFYTAVRDDGETGDFNTHVLVVPLPSFDLVPGIVIQGSGIVRFTGLRLRRHVLPARARLLLPSFGNSCCALQ